jgi:UDP-glucuronate decarboxylase
MVDTANQLKQRNISGKVQDVRTAGSSTPLPVPIVSSPSRDDVGSNSNKKSPSSGCFSGRTVMILLFGVMFGYMVLPIVLVETSMMAFNDGPAGNYFDGPKNHLRNLQEEKVVGDRLKNLMENQYILSHQSLPTDRAPHIMETPTLSDHRRKKILVTGGAGFVGSHLVDKLMMEGHEVTVLDNFFTGQKKNVAHWFQHPNFNLVIHDVTEPIHLEVDEIYHLACPASPPHYQFNPVKTIKTSTMGTLNMLGLAKRVRAKILLTSTSEIYGDPQVHPQREDYWGNVNPIGPRSCYDEGKRVAETMMYSYHNQNNVDIRIARIFNTFGPRMHPNDGRVVSNFIIQALQNKPLTVYGEGEQTRSFQYVSDLVDGLHALMNNNYDGPVNLGNPDEFTMKEFAEYVKDLTKSESEIKFLPKTQDDPSKRRPDISLAKEKLDWEPKVPVEEGITKTIAYFQSVLDEAGEIIPTGPGASKPQN